MSNPSSEEQLDRLIDQLNKEETPVHSFDPEMTEFSAVARAVKSSVGPSRSALDPDFGDRLIENLTKADNRSPALRHRHLLMRRLGKIAIAGVAAAALILWGFKGDLFAPNSFHPDIVSAMEQSVARLTSYHGVLEEREENAAGEVQTLQRIELWWTESGKYVLKDQNGIMTVNNGEKKWQVVPAQHQITLIPLLPDSPPYLTDLQDEAQRAKSYPHTELGEEKVAGHSAVKLQISPPGGIPYYLWIDSESRLPLQLQTGMQNSLQLLITFVSFEANTAVDSSLFRYNVPQGYTVVDQDTEQAVTSVTDGIRIAGFTPILPEQAPQRIFATATFPSASSARLVFDYGDTVITEFPTLPPDSSNFGLSGKPGEGVLALIGADTVYCRQNGIDIQIDGPQWKTFLKQMLPDITVPNSSADTAGSAQVKVDVNMDVEKNNQAQVDGGHSPWQLDPVQVAQAFVDGQLHPATPPSGYKIQAINDAEAVVTVQGGPVAKIYLKRLVRQDNTGIWSVMGYDPN